MVICAGSCLFSWTVGWEKGQGFGGGAGRKEQQWLSRLLCRKRGGGGRHVCGARVGRREPLPRPDTCRRGDSQRARVPRWGVRAARDRRERARGGSGRALSLCPSLPFRNNTQLPLRPRPVLTSERQLLADHGVRHGERGARARVCEREGQEGWEARARGGRRATDSSGRSRSLSRVRRRAVVGGGVRLVGLRGVRGWS